MVSSGPGDITELLADAAAGKPGAPDALLRRVYGELHRIAVARTDGRLRAHSFQATELVNEAYIKLFDGGVPDWKNRAHFFGAAACAMRDIMVDRARHNATKKRGGDRRRVDDKELTTAERESIEFLALHEALHALESDYPEHARIVMLKYFAGLQIDEIAQMTDTSTATIGRHWKFARSWLKKALVETTNGVGSASDLLSEC